jgi:hypothetical protein
VQFTTAIPRRLGELCAWPRVCLLLLAIGLSNLPAGRQPAALAKERSDHWSFQRPVRPQIPDQAALKFGGLVRNPVDHFILERIEEQGLQPAPPADKHTLIRRAFFDLVGLPPSPEEVTRFVHDESVDAWPNLIDELLQSKHYGERWGRHWLDVARYADSGGYETDIYYRNAWRYRDYVVKSFNDDKPYDR